AGGRGFQSAGLNCGRRSAGLIGYLRPMGRRFAQIYASISNMKLSAILGVRKKMTGKYYPIFIDITPW
ncbi:MAG: hypothetical protein Q7W05_08290, partial [Deltaproteobacteria bacterium]|nr:hypothetical protein [Deltaproteobacteria bacterium]